MAETECHMYGVVAVIYIGTYSCDCAFSTLEQYDKAHSFARKPRSCILFNSKKEFMAFGQDAEDQYDTLCSDGKEMDYYFFRGLNTKLFNNCITSESEIQDVKGKKLSSIHVLSTTFQHIKDKMMQKSSKHTVQKHDLWVLWVFLLPDVWKKSLKPIMMEAARNAGIQENHFDVISEPEAACIWCHHLHNNVIKYDRLACLLETYTDTLVVDTGCESPSSWSGIYNPIVDVTVSVVRREGRSEMLKEVNSWKLRSNPVDDIFSDFLSNVFGSNVMDEFQDDHLEEHTELFHMFYKKLTNWRDQRGQVTFRLPIELIEGFKRKRGIAFKDHIKLNYLNMSLTGNLLKVTDDKGMCLMESAFENIVYCLKNVLDKSQIGDVPTIIIYGWCADSTFLQTCVRKSFPYKRIIVPTSPEYAAIMGALLFGHGVPSFNMETVAQPKKRKQKLYSEK